MMDFHREVKSLMRLSQKISSSSVPINDLRAAVGFTPLPIEGGGRQQGHKSLRGRELSGSCNGRPASSQLLVVWTHPEE